MQHREHSPLSTHFQMWKLDYLVKAETISSFVKLSSWEPKSCKYKQSGMLQGWTNKNIDQKATKSDLQGTKTIKMLLPCFLAKHDNTLLFQNKPCKRGVISLN